MGLAQLEHGRIDFAEVLRRAEKRAPSRSTVGMSFNEDRFIVQPQERRVSAVSLDEFIVELQDKTI